MQFRIESLLGVFDLLLSAPEIVLDGAELAPVIAGASDVVSRQLNIALSQ